MILAQIRSAVHLSNTVVEPLCKPHRLATIVHVNGCKIILCMQKRSKYDHLNISFKFCCPCRNYRLLGYVCYFINNRVLHHSKLLKVLQMLGYPRACLHLYLRASMYSTIRLSELENITLTMR